MLAPLPGHHEDREGDGGASAEMADEGVGPAAGLQAARHVDLKPYKRDLSTCLRIFLESMNSKTAAL